MNKEDINLRVRDILAQKNMDCTSLAEKMGKSPQYVNNILNKRKDMSLNSLMAVAEALGVEFGDLFASSFTPKPRCGAPDIMTLTKRTLERLLRFPRRQDYGIISELIANLSRCMSHDDWIKYYGESVEPLLPPDFALDSGHLSMFMDESEIESLARSL